MQKRKHENTLKNVVARDLNTPLARLGILLLCINMHTGWFHTGLFFLHILLKFIISCPLSFVINEA